MKVIVNRQRERERLIVLLPPVAAGAGTETHWWLVAGTDIVRRGQSADWLSLQSDRATAVIGLAPTQSLRVAFPGVPAESSERQRLTLARLAALEGSLADSSTLHAVASDRGGETGPVVAIAANDVMLGWLQWAEGHGARLDHIVPAAMVLPFEEEWLGATVGADAVIGRRGTVLPDEPGLKDQLVDGPVAMLDSAEVEAGLVALAENPTPDLRSGRFARRQLLIDRSQWKLVASLAAAIVLVTTLVAVVEILKLQAATARLDAETLAVAQRVDGPAATLETAEAAVARHSARGSRLTGTFAALLSRLSSDPNVTLSTLGSSNAVVTASLFGNSPQAAGAVLQSLQRDGYRVTAVPRQSPDGRAAFDVTIQEGQ